MNYTAKPNTMNFTDKIHKNVSNHNGLKLYKIFEKVLFYSIQFCA